MACLRERCFLRRAPIFLCACPAPALLSCSREYDYRFTSRRIPGELSINTTSSLLPFHSSRSCCEGFKKPDMRFSQVSAPPFSAPYRHRSGAECAKSPTVRLFGVL